MRFLPILLLLIACSKTGTRDSVKLSEACQACFGYCEVVLSVDVQHCTKETCTCVFPDESLDTRKWDESDEELAARLKRLEKWPRSYNQPEDPTPPPDRVTDDGTLTSEEWCQTFIGEEDYDSCLAHLKASPSSQEAAPSIAPHPY